MNLLNILLIISQFVTFLNFIQLYVFETDAFILTKSQSIAQLKNTQNKLSLKINSDSDGKIKYTTDLNHLKNYDLSNIYTIIGSKNDIRCDKLIKRLRDINKKFIFIDETLYEKENMNQLISYFNSKQKINLENIGQPWMFYENEYILKDDVFKHLL
jgi:hypothetical protein